MIGKPCAGKLHARFDEGELEIEPCGDYASSLLYSITGTFHFFFDRHYTLRNETSYSLADYSRHLQLTANFL